jgi:hypothetical protein
MKGSTSTSTSKPLSRANAAIISKKPQSRVGNQQPSTADLKKLGIKVRDFAYEKTLPPVRTIHLHRQVLPGVARQTIARQKTEEDASQSQSQPRMVDRTPTEPSLTPVPPKRVRGLFDLELEESDDENITLSQQTSTPEFLSNAKTPQILFESQESQPRRDDTPVVTPNGSWNSQNSSGIPRSRYNEPSQAPIPQMLSNSQPLLDNQPKGSTSQQSLPSIQSSPLPHAPSSKKHALPPSTLPHSMPSNGTRTLSSTSRNHHADSTKELRLPTTPTVITPRYHLRKRPAPLLAAPKPAKRRKKHMSPEKCNLPESSCPRPVPAKSMHSRNRPHEEMGSPSSRILRQRSTKSKRKCA